MRLVLRSLLDCFNRNPNYTGNLKSKNFNQSVAIIKRTKFQTAKETRTNSPVQAESMEAIHNGAPEVNEVRFTVSYEIKNNAAK